MADHSQQVFIPDTFRQRPYAREHFARIARHAWQHHPFYQQKITDPAHHWPLLTRQEILHNNALFLDGHAPTAATSGSTGVPVRFAWSAEKTRNAAALNQQFVALLGGPLPRTRFVRRIEPNSNDGFDIHLPVAEQAAILQRRYQQHQAVAVITYPSNALSLSQYVLEHGLDMSFIQRFGCFAEVFDSHHEHAIQAAFPNAQIWSTYSAMELGLIAFRCPFEPQFHHYCAGSLGVEVLDEHHQSCAPEQVGRLVVTDYINTLSPFIRYDIGDLVARSQCPCQRIHLPAFSQVLGKVRGMLKDKHGHPVMFSGLDAALRDIPGIGQYQVVQEGPCEFQLRYVNLAASTDQLERQVHQCFQAQFGYPVTIRFEAVDVIAREANGKFYASICKI